MFLISALVFVPLSVAGHHPGALALDNMVSASAALFSTSLRNFSPLLLSDTVTSHSLDSGFWHSWTRPETLVSRLSVWRGSMVGLPVSFAWANFSVLAIGVWAIAQRDSIDAVIMVSFYAGPFAPCDSKAKLQAQPCAPMLTYLTVECGTFWYPSPNSLTEQGGFHGAMCRDCLVREWCLLCLGSLNQVEQKRNSVSEWEQKKVENVACDCRFLGDNLQENPTS